MDNSYPRSVILVFTKGKICNERKGLSVLARRDRLPTARRFQQARAVGANPYARARNISPKRERFYIRAGERVRIRAKNLLALLEFFELGCAALQIGAFAMAQQRSRFWMLAATHRDQEWRAAHHTERLGFNFYLPQIRGLVGREFLFPGYLFIQLKAGWEVIIRQRGIRRLFLTDEVPWKIREEKLDLIRNREDANGIVNLTQQPRFKLGSRLIYKRCNDAFDGTIGIYDGDTPSRRCRVLFDMLGRAVPLEIDDSYLELAA